MGVITFNAKDFVKGISTSDDLSDAGFSNRSRGQNLLANVGTINAKPAITTKTSNTVANEAIIAQSNSSNPQSFDSFFVSDGEDFFSTQFGSEPIIKQSTVDTVGIGRTDMKVYKEAVYISTLTNVTKISSADVSTIVPTWWTGTASPAGSALAGDVHPMLVFDTKLFVANSTQLDYTDGTGVTEDLLPLNEEEAISALGIYEPTGDMLVAVDSGSLDSNDDAVYPGNAKILIWDGFSAVRNREVRVPERITTFFNSGGVTYVVMGRTFGYFNGNGIVALRKLNIDFSVNSVITSQKITELDDTIYIAEGDDVLAFGKLYPNGNRVFYYPYTTVGNQISTIRAYYNDPATDEPYVAITYLNGTNPTFAYFSTRNDAGGGDAWYSNIVYLPSNSKIRKVEVLTEPLTSGDTLNLEMLKTSTDGTTGIGTMDYSTDGAIAQKTLARDKNIETAAVQVAATQSSGSVRIKQIKVHYDAIEKPI
jgi:hypothetical protein